MVKVNYEKLNRDKANAVANANNNKKPGLSVSINYDKINAEAAFNDNLIKFRNERSDYFKTKSGWKSENSPKNEVRIDAYTSYDGTKPTSKNDVIAAGNELAEKVRNGTATDDDYRKYVNAEALYGEGLYNGFQSRIEAAPKYHVAPVVDSWDKTGISETELWKTEDEYKKDASALTSEMQSAYGKYAKGEMSDADINAFADKFQRFAAKEKAYFSDRYQKTGTLATADSLKLRRDAARDANAETDARIKAIDMEVANARRESPEYFQGLFAEKESLENSKTNVDYKDTESKYYSALQFEAEKDVADKYDDYKAEYGKNGVDYAKKSGSFDKVDGVTTEKVSYKGASDFLAKYTDAYKTSIDSNIRELNEYGTDEQKDIFLQLFTEKGYKDALNYAKEIHPLISKQAAKIQGEKYEDSNALERFGMGVGAVFEGGIGDIGQSITGLVKAANRDTSYTHRNTAQQKADAVIEAEQNPVADLLMQGGRSAVANSPSIIVGVATGGSSLASTAVLFASAAGSSYVDAINKGNGYYASLGYGITNGVLEAATEKLFDVPGFYGGSKVDDALKGMISKRVSKLSMGTKGKTALNFLGYMAANGFGEAVEEGIMAAVEPTLGNIFLGEKNESFTAEHFGEIGYAALLGTTSSFLMPLSYVSTYADAKGDTAVWSVLNGEKVTDMQIEDIVNSRSSREIFEKTMGFELSDNKDVAKAQVTAVANSIRATSETIKGADVSSVVENIDVSSVAEYTEAVSDYITEPDAEYVANETEAVAEMTEIANEELAREAANKEDTTPTEAIENAASEAVEETVSDLMDGVSTETASINEGVEADEELVDYGVNDRQAALERAVDGDGEIARLTERYENGEISEAEYDEAVARRVSEIERSISEGDGDVSEADSAPVADGVTENGGTSIMSKDEFDVVRNNSYSVTRNSAKDIKANPIFGKVSASDIRAFRAVGKALGVDVKAFDGETLGLTGTDGAYDPKTRTIYLNVTSPLKAISSAFRHEVIHYLKASSPKAFSEFATFVIDKYKAQYSNEDYNAWLEAKRKEYEAMGTTLTKDGAVEEFLAQYGMDMLQQKAIARDFVRKHRNAALKIWDAIRNLINKIRRFYGMQELPTSVYDAISQLAENTSGQVQVSGNSYTRSHLQGSKELLPGELNIDALNAADEALLNAFAEVADINKRVQAKMKNAPKDVLNDDVKRAKYIEELWTEETGVAPVGDKDVKFGGKDVSPEEMAKTMFNLAAVESHKKKLDEKFNAKASDVSEEQLKKRYAMAISLWEGVSDSLKSKYLNKWNNLKGKDRAFTVFKAQSGYKYTVELSSKCRKGLSVFEAIDEIVKDEAMKRLDTDVIGKEEKEILYEILREKGFEIPCAICYVEQARQREGAIIKAFLDGKIEKTKSGKVTTYKLGWNETLHKIEEGLKAKGIDYTFPAFDRSIATDNYTASEVVMPENVQNAFYEVLVDLTNAEIERYNAESTGKTKYAKIKDSSPSSVNAVLKGNLPLNLAMLKTLFNETNSRMTIDEDLLYSSMVTHNLAYNNQMLYSVFNRQGGTGGYKTKQNGVVYWGDVLSKGYAPGTVRREGGIRGNSNSDFEMHMFLDYAQMYIDYTAKGYYAQEYSKVISKLKLFGLSGIKLNASLIPKVKVVYKEDGKVDVEKTRERAGLDENGILIFDDFEGANHAEVFMLTADPVYSKNVGAICVGYSDAHISALLDDNRIQQIIGFHDKTDNPDKRYSGAKFAKNYNGLNEATKKKDGETVHIGFNQFVINAEKMFGKNKADVEFGGKTYSWNDVPKLAADLYLKHCEDNGLNPAYSQNNGADGIDFSKHPNYYKLLADFSLYDSKGNYAPHSKVAFNLPGRVPILNPDGSKTFAETGKYIEEQLKSEIAVRDNLADALADKSENGIVEKFVKKVNEDVAKRNADADSGVKFSKAKVDNGEDSGYNKSTLDSVSYEKRYNELSSEERSYYDRAKKGDSSSAFKLISALVGTNNKGVDFAKISKDTYLLPVIGAEGTSDNILPSYIAEYFGDEYGLRTFDGIYKSNESNSRSQGVWNRMKENYPSFEIGKNINTSVIKGKKFILIDDNSTTGRTFNGLKSFIEENGGTVEGYYALTVGQDASEKMTVNEDTWKKATDIGIEKLKQFAKEEGVKREISRQGLTERECQELINRWEKRRLPDTGRRTADDRTASGKTQGVQGLSARDGETGAVQETSTVKYSQSSPDSSDTAYIPKGEKPARDIDDVKRLNKMLEKKTQKLEKTNADITARLADAERRLKITKPYSPDSKQIDALAERIADTFIGEYRGKNTVSNIAKSLTEIFRTWNEGNVKGNINKLAEADRMISNLASTLISGTSEYYGENEVVKALAGELTEEITSITPVKSTAAVNALARTEESLARTERKLNESDSKLSAARDVIKLTESNLKKAEAQLESTEKKLTVSTLRKESLQKKVDFLSHTRPIYIQKEIAQKRFDNANALADAAELDGLKSVALMYRNDIKFWQKQLDNIKRTEEYLDRKAMDRRKLREHISQKLGVPLATPDRSLPFVEQLKLVWNKHKNDSKELAVAKAVYKLNKEESKALLDFLKGEISYEEVIELGNKKTKDGEARYNVDKILKLAKAMVNFANDEAVIADYNNETKRQRDKTTDEFLDRVDEAGGINDKVLAFNARATRETPERVIRMIVKDESLANEMINYYVKPIHTNEASANRFKNEVIKKVKDLKLETGIKKGNIVSESYAVQFVGEVEDNIRYLEKNAKSADTMRDGKTLLEWRETLDEFKKSNPSLDFDRIHKAIDVFRGIYDDLFSRVNEARMLNGYPPMPYRSGYFPHFTDEGSDGLLSKAARSMGLSGTVSELPSNISGLTYMFKPGIKWMANAMERTGYLTAFDALEGLDRYLASASDVIFHTGDIQRLRSLERRIRYRATDNGIKDRVDLIRGKRDWSTEKKKNRIGKILNDAGDDITLETQDKIRKIEGDTSLTIEEQDKRIAEIFENARFDGSNFVVWLGEYTNNLAGKQALTDRIMEQKFGRAAFNVVSRLEGRIAKNMIIGNMSSYMSNFIPLTQATAVLDSPASLTRGMIGTIRSIFKQDAVSTDSDFYRNRLGSDVLSMTFGEKFADKLLTPMEIIDKFVAGSIVRARYYDNLKKGMSESDAMDEADTMAANIMADRSKGSVPVIFNDKNPISKMFTMFQVEVNNQVSFWTKDISAEAKKRGVANMALRLMLASILAWLFNDWYEELTGRKPALSPIDIINDAVGKGFGVKMRGPTEIVKELLDGDDQYWNPEKVEDYGIWQGISEFGEGVAEQLPFTSALNMFGLELDSGRIPVSGAYPDLAKLFKTVLDGKTSSEKKWDVAKDELVKPFYYAVLPMGGGQIKKINEGIGAIRRGGSYSNADKKGKRELQYPVFTDEGVWNIIKTVMFGKSSNEGAAEWVERGFKNALGDTATEVYISLKDSEAVSQRDVYNFLVELSGINKDTVLDGIIVPEDASADVKKRAFLRQSSLPDEVKAIIYAGYIADKKNDEPELELLERAGDNVGVMYTVISDMKDGNTDNDKRIVLWNGNLPEGDKYRLYKALMYNNGEGSESAVEAWQKEDEKIDAFWDADLSFDDYLKARIEKYGIEQKGLKPAEEAARFYSWARDNYGDKKAKAIYSTLPASFGSVIAIADLSAANYADAGLSNESTNKVLEALGGLEPLPGKNQVSDFQKASKIISLDLSDKEKMGGLKVVLDDGAYEKVESAYKLKIGLDVYYGIAGKYDTAADNYSALDDNGKKKMKEKLKRDGYGDMTPNQVSAYLIIERYGDGLNKPQKAALWQLQNKSWKGDNNPYGENLGNAFRKNMGWDK